MLRDVKSDKSNYTLYDFTYIKFYKGKNIGTENKSVVARNRGLRKYIDRL